MSTLAVVEDILREIGRPVSVREIVEFAGDRLPTKSKTPDTVVARDLSMDIKKKGEDSIFIRTSPGRYTMRELVSGTDTNASSDNGQDTTTNLSGAAITEGRAPTRPARSSTSDGVSQQPVAHDG
jgi:hypothetical protein